MPNPTHDASEEKLPRDLDEFLMIVKRRLANADPRGWMRCTSRRCLRERRCVDVDLPCRARGPVRPMTDAERIAAMASLTRALRERSVM